MGLNSFDAASISFFFEIRVSVVFEWTNEGRVSARSFGSRNHPVQSVILIDDGHLLATAALVHRLELALCEVGHRGVHSVAEPGWIGRSLLNQVVQRVITIGHGWLEITA